MFNRGQFLLICQFSEDDLKARSRRGLLPFTQFRAGEYALGDALRVLVVQDLVDHGFPQGPAAKAVRECWSEIYEQIDQVQEESAADIWVAVGLRKPKTAPFATWYATGPSLRIGAKMALEPDLAAMAMANVSRAYQVLAHRVRGLGLEVNPAELLPIRQEPTP